MLTKDHAEDIARKLKADIRKKKAHDIAVIAYNGVRVAQFGIRRGSKRNQGHDHLPNSLHLSPHETLMLAQCNISMEQWIEMMRQKGFIQDRTQGTESVN